MLEDSNGGNKDLVNTIIFAKALHSEPFSFDLFHGFERLRILTYSASIPMIIDLVGHFASFECIFGYEKIALGLHDIWAFQQVTNDTLIRTVHGLDNPRRQVLFDKIRNGNAHFRLLKDSRSHAKLYLLDGPDRHRVIVGSSNASAIALGALPPTVGRHQHEINVAFDNDDLMWERCEQEYLDIRDRSTSSVVIPVTQAQLGPISFEDIPLNREAAKHDVLIAVPNSAALPTVVLPVAERLSRTYQAAAHQVSRSRSVFTLSPRILGKVATAIRSRRDDEGSTVETLSFSPDKTQMTVAGTAVNLVVDEAAAQADARLLIEYINNFEHGFIGPVAHQQRQYFAFLAWFYLSPLMSDLLHHAKFTDGLIYNYPMFAILYGKSNCGKSRLVETVMTSMLGHYKIRAAGDFTPSKIGNLQIDSVRFPIVFDDVSRDRFKGAYELIKQTTDGVVAATELAPFVFSMNAEEGHAFPDEIKKRCFVVYTSATLPRNRPETDQNYATVRRIQRTIGTSLYRAYLRRVFDALAHETPTDYLTFSSTILCELFASATNAPLPTWCTPISHKDMQATQDEKIKETLLELWRTNPRAWNVQRDRVVLRVEPAEVHSLRKDIPGWILNEGASKGGNLVMDRGQLEHFLNRSLRRSLWTRLMPK